MAAKPLFHLSKQHKDAVLGWLNERTFVLATKKKKCTPLHTKSQ